MIKEALEYIAELKEESMVPQVLDINGKTYCNKSLKRYGEEAMAEAIRASTLTSLTDYIKECGTELREHMIIHVVSPVKVLLYSGLTSERKRETLFIAEASVPDFRFDYWYDQERFVIGLQADFDVVGDLMTVLKVAGNVESKTTASYGDDGISQKTTIKQGIASRADVLVPSPVILTPYRTFAEIEQPESQFIFRINEKDNAGVPQFKLIEAEGGLWKTRAMTAIKEYLVRELDGYMGSRKLTVIA